MQIDVGVDWAEGTEIDPVAALVTRASNAYGSSQADLVRNSA